MSLPPLCLDDSTAAPAATASSPPSQDRKPSLKPPAASSHLPHPSRYSKSDSSCHLLTPFLTQSGAVCKPGRHWHQTDPSISPRELQASSPNIKFIHTWDFCTSVVSCDILAGVTCRHISHRSVKNLDAKKTKHPARKDHQSLDRCQMTKIPSVSLLTWRKLFLPPKITDLKFEFFKLKKLHILDS